MKKISHINAQKKADEAVLKGPDFENREAELLSWLMPFSPESSRFTVTCRREDYSAGRIARAIEDCNANVLNLNVTADTSDEGHVAVDIRVDRKNIDAIARSLARYDYTVAGVDDAASVFNDSDRRRVDELLRYLDI